MPEQEGIKYDQGKRRLGEMVVDFKDPLLSVCGVWEFGANKYNKSNWKYVENGKDRYTNAMLRHLVEEEEEIIDSESGLLHATHVAWNALARLHFILQECLTAEQCEAIDARYKAAHPEPIQLKLPFDMSDSDIGTAADDASVSENDTYKPRYTYGTRCE